MFRGIRRLWVAVAMLPLLAGLAFASGPSRRFICEGDLIARAQCCCPAAQHETSGPAGDDGTVSPACCCRVSRTDARSTTAVTEPAVAPQLTAKILLAPGAAPNLDTLTRSYQAQSPVGLAHPPPRAVPILLGKQSFLI